MGSCSGRSQKEMIVSSNLLKDIKIQSESILKKVKGLDVSKQAFPTHCLINPDNPRFQEEILDNGDEGNNMKPYLDNIIVYYSIYIYFRLLKILKLKLMQSL